MSVASDFATTIATEVTAMADAEALRPAPYVGPGGLVTISVLNDGNGQVTFGTNTYPLPAAVAVALANYLLATFA
jgi:hypothetical protein